MVTATDIAFALGILALLGSRVPVALKVFLLAVAIINDLGAIVIIAVFYTSDLSTNAQTLSMLGFALAVTLNCMGVQRISPRLALFVPFILITTFVEINLVVGLVVNSMQNAHSVEADERTDTYRDDVIVRLSEIERLLKTAEQRQRRLAAEASHLTSAKRASAARAAWSRTSKAFMFSQSRGQKRTPQDRSRLLVKTA